MQQAKRTRSDLSWGLHPLVSHRFSESKIRLFLSLEECVRLYAKVLASIKLDSGRFKRRHNRKAGSSFWIRGRFRASWSTALLPPCVPSRRKTVPSKYLCAEPRIAQPGLGDPGPLGAGLGRLFPPGGFVPLRVPGARQAGPGPVGRVLCHRSRSVLATVQITLPVPAPSETLVCKPDDAGQGRSWAGRVLLGVGTGARPPIHLYRAVPPTSYPRRAAPPGPRGHLTCSGMETGLTGNK